MRNATFRALLAAALGVLGLAGCNPFKWPPKLISERTWHVELHKPAPSDKTGKPAVSPPTPPAER